MPDRSLPDPFYVSVAEAAELLGVHRNAIYYAVEAGRLTTVRVMGKRALLREHVLAYRPKSDPRRRPGQGNGRYVGPHGHASDPAE